MPSIIAGTAGHIDHGKTSLVRRLTGTDTDRLKEEKQRGITIELGFAHMMLGDIQLGIVDVPGHERFIKSMVAGATGIDLVVLVVAADEGVMPQTREHLDICQLLGVQRGLVALTKADLVDAEWLQLVQEDVRSTLAGTFLEEAKIVPCSATDGRGMEELEQEMGRVAGQVTPRDASGLLRLPLDRVFSLKGFGTVVTGTLGSGTIRVGEEVEVLPQQRKAMVRRLQVHNSDVDVAVAGQRTAVNLSGVERAEISRGEVLVHPKNVSASHIVDVEIALLSGTRKALKGRAKVLFHLGTRQQEATCVLLGRSTLPGGTKGLAQLRFEKPIIATPDDRFILRSFTKQENYGTTVGGGRILRVLSKRIRPKERERIALLEQIAGASGKRRVELEVAGAGPSGFDRHDLAERLPYPPTELERHVKVLCDEAVLFRYDKDAGAVVHREAMSALRERLLSLLAEFHRSHPLEEGVNREELRNKLGSFVPSRLFFNLCQRLVRAGELVIQQDLIRHSEHRVRGESIAPTAEKLAALCHERGLAAPREAELPQLLEATAEDVRQATKLLVNEERLIRIGGMVFGRNAVEKLEQMLRDHLAEHESIDAAVFKQLVGQSRKFAIPLAEYFDAQKVTIRIGDERKLRNR